MGCKSAPNSARSPSYEPRSWSNFRHIAARSRLQTKTKTGSEPASNARPSPPDDLPKIMIRSFSRLLALGCCALLLGATARPASAQTAVRADTVYTMDGPPIVDGVVLVRDGQIERVGAASAVEVPSGYAVREATVVTPGIVDGHSVVGLAGIYNVDADQDQLETSAPAQPALRAIDAYNAREELVAWARSLGVTTLHTGHGPGAPISGQTMVVKTSGNTVGEALVDSVAMMAMTLGPSVERNFQSPGTRAKTVAMIREQLIKAQAYREQMNSADGVAARDLGMEALAHVLDGEITAMITAHRARDIMSALRLAEEFGFRLALDGAAEAYMVLDEIQAAGVPVIIHPTMIRPGGDAANAAFTTAATLHEAGIPFAFQSGYEGYVPKTRVPLFEAAIAVANGLPREAALNALTLAPAQILGLGDQHRLARSRQRRRPRALQRRPLRVHHAGLHRDGRRRSRQRQLPVIERLGVWAFGCVGVWENGVSGVPCPLPNVKRSTSNQRQNVQRSNAQPQTHNPKRTTQNAPMNALFLTPTDDGMSAAVRAIEADALPEGDVLVDVLYSSLNYKDGLAVTGKGKIIRGDFPFVPGIDLVGRVKTRAVKDTGAEGFEPGDLVIQTGWGLGEYDWGGYAQQMRVQAKHLVPLPDGLTPKQAMIIGTAGYTAMLAVMALEDHGADPDASGEIVVTGASGGAGSIAVALLGARGYDAVASTGTASAHDYLRALGASRIVDRSAFDEGPERPMQSAQWAGAIDAVGGQTLATIISELERHASVASFGNAGGHELHTTVFPFILRGVNLLGIDSNTCPNDRRRVAWQRLADLLTDAHFERLLNRTISLEEVPAASAEITRGEVRGRIVVDVNA